MTSTRSIPAWIVFNDSARSISSYGTLVRHPCSTPACQAQSFVDSTSTTESPTGVRVGQLRNIDSAPFDPGNTRVSPVRFGAVVGLTGAQ